MRPREVGEEGDFSRSLLLESGSERWPVGIAPSLVKRVCRGVFFPNRPDFLEEDLPPELVVDLLFFFPKKPRCWNCGCGVAGLFHTEREKMNTDERGERESFKMRGGDY